MRKTELQSEGTRLMIYHLNEGESVELFPPFSPLKGACSAIDHLNGAMCDSVDVYPLHGEDYINTITMLKRAGFERVPSPPKKIFKVVPACGEPLEAELLREFKGGYQVACRDLTLMFDRDTMAIPDFNLKLICTELEPLEVDGWGLFYQLHGRPVYIGDDFGEEYGKAKGGTPPRQPEESGHVRLCGEVSRTSASVVACEWLKLEDF